MFAFIVFLLAFMTPFGLNAEMKFPWIVYYNNLAPPDAFLPYNPIIFDSYHHPSMDILLEKQKEVLGYIDLGEASENDPWFDEVKERGILINLNPNWKGSWSVDIRNIFWKDLVINKIIPEILEKGFTGLFFDQLDVSLNLERQNPSLYKGMTEAAIDLVKAIRKFFPGRRLMLNRAYEILPMIGNDIDYVLAETLYTSYNFETKQYFIRPKNEFDWQLSQLNAARQKFPHLVIFSLDYWDSKDSENIKKIYAIERENCIRPYVSPVILDSVIPEP